MNVDKLRAALERATPGWWRTSAGDLFAGGCLVGDCGAWQDTDDNARAIVLAVNALRTPGALELLALLNGPDDAMVERVWLALCKQCAATPEKEHDKVKGLVMVRKDDLRAALAAAKEANSAKS